LPVAALYRVYTIQKNEVNDEEEVKKWGMFYTAFRKETWW
jgi:hypothetical protein